MGGIRRQAWQPLTRLHSPAGRSPGASLTGNLGQDRGTVLLEEVQRLRRRLIQSQIETTMSLVAAVEAKDAHTESHSLQVSRFAEALALELHFSRRETEVLKNAAILHDIGKIGVPDAILSKPGPLTEAEFERIRQHPRIGAGIVRSATCLRRELPLILHHHEWYDGSGYPDRLRGSQIPFSARVLQVADSIDAMLYPRPYKEAYAVCRVIDELERGRGRQFDPTVVDSAVSWLSDRAEPIPTAIDCNPGEQMGL